MIVVLLLVLSVLLVLGCTAPPADALQDNETGDGQTVVALPVTDTELSELDGLLSELDAGTNDLDPLNELDLNPLSDSDFQ